MTDESKFESAKALGLDDEIYWMAERLLEVHPQRELLGVEGCLQLAQFGYAIGAMVLPVEANEIHVYQEATREIVMQAGINYFRRKGNEAGGYMMVEPKPMDTKQMGVYGAKNGELAYICKVLPNRDLERLERLGLKFSEYLNDFAFVGSAVVTKEEMKEGAPPKGRTWAWVGMKRAERDALSKAFPHTRTGLDIVHVDVETEKPKARKPERKPKPTVEEINEELFP